jgi:[NiFe] hydrogenase diaphorase moiety large subunit
VTVTTVADPAFDDSTLDEAVRRAIEAWGSEPTQLLQVLRGVQETLGFLPTPAIARIASALGVPIARVRGVVAFYSFLYAEPRGTYRVLFSDNVTDRMRGSKTRLEEMCHRLWVEPGKVSEDGLVSIDRTSCIGMGDQAPAVLVNGWPVPRVDAARAAELCDLMLSRVPLDEWPRELFVVEDHIHRSDVMLSDPQRPGDAIRAALARGDASGTGPQGCSLLESLRTTSLPERSRTWLARRPGV